MYAGVGGICLGFIKAGAEITWANEFDKYACQTYKKNFSHELREVDVWKLNPNKLKKVDIITAGFPCQPFSLAGYQKGFEDERGNHFFRILYFLNTLKPKAVFLENVKNLNGHNNGSTISTIKLELERFNYKVEIEVLNTSEYGNLPQNRERIFIVGFRNSRNGKNPYFKHFTLPTKIKLKKTIDKFIEKQKVDEKYYYRDDKYMYEDIINVITQKNTFYQWRRVYVRENKNNQCPTLTANMGTGGHNVPLILSEYGIRKLTPRECFKFQGFTTSFKLPKDVSDTQLYKQVGNSVSIPVVKRIAQKIIFALERGENN